MNWVERELAFLRSERMPALDPKFWDDFDSWPRGDRSTVFAGHALQEAGKALFGTEWTGEELKAFSFYPPVSNSFSQQARRAKSFGSQEPMILDEVTIAAWNGAVSDNEQLLRRLTTAIDWLSDRARDGDLSTLIRFKDTSKGNGSYLQPPRGLWNVENVIDYRYRSGSFRIAIVAGSRTPHEMYAFFTRESLDACLAQARDDAGSSVIIPETAVDLHLSPFMMLALEVIQKKKIAPSHQGKHEDIRDEVLKLATERGLEVGATMAKYIATIVRDPESRQGRAKKG